jgi:hypothetical protein
MFSNALLDATSDTGLLDRIGMAVDPMAWVAGNGFYVLGCDDSGSADCDLELMDLARLIAEASGD